MSDTVRESLSALMDGEASDLELRRILNADQRTIRSEWADLHRGQQLLKNESSPFLGWDISSQVMAEIAGDEFVSAPESGWKQAVSGLAIAASVAAVVVLGSLGSNMFDSSSQMIADNNLVSGRVYPAQVTLSAVGGVAVSAQAQASPAGPLLNNDIEARKRFEAYLRKHTDRAAFNNGQGMVSYARVVSQESE